MGRLSRQADVGGGGHRLPRAVGGDIGERPLQPDIDLVTRVAVIWDDIPWRCSLENLAAAFREITPKDGYLDTGWQALQLERCPFQLADVDDRLIRAE